MNKKQSIFLLVAAFFFFTFFARDALFAQEISMIEENGIIMHVYCASPENFAVTSTVLEGKNDAVLINAQFSNADARRLVDLIKKTGKNLTTIYISHHDPDFYFGLKYIADQFPEAKILATPQTAYLIEATKDAKLELWKPQLKGNAPTGFIIPDAIDGDHFMLENIRIELKQMKDNPDFSYLWIPSLRTVLGGTYLYDNLHVWMADLPVTESPDKWLRALAGMEALKPEYTIPGHFIMEKSNLRGTDAVKFTRKYITAFVNEAESAKNSAELIAAMKKLYPDLAGEPGLDIGAKVRKGELQWARTESFPPIAKKMTVRFGNNIFELDFKDHKSMSFIGTQGDFKGYADTVAYKAILISPGIYMVYWSEPVIKSHVVHVEDFNSKTVYTNIVTKESAFINMKGTLSLAD